MSLFLFREKISIGIALNHNFKKGKVRVTLYGQILSSLVAHALKPLPNVTCLDLITTERVNKRIGLHVILYFLSLV